MTTDSILNQVDQLIRSRSILEHPFYQAWNNGELTLDQLRSYSKIYYPHVAAFPDYLRSALETATDAKVVSELEDNLREELSEPKAHDELWLDFAEGLGVSRNEVTSAPVHATTAKTVSTFLNLASSTSAEALAALYAYESQQPEVSATKAHGLKERYGVESSDALAYFDVHSEADVRHSAGERRVLAGCIERGATAEEILEATGTALDAYWQLLDGVCIENGIALEN